MSLTNPIRVSRCVISFPHPAPSLFVFDGGGPVFSDQRDHKHVKSLP